MKSQKQIILNMLLDSEWICVTRMMENFIPDYRRRICDLKEDYILESRSCTQHDHRSKNLKEWHLVGKNGFAPQTYAEAEVYDVEKNFSDIKTIPAEILQTLF